MCGLQVSGAGLRQKDHACGIHGRVLHSAKELGSTDRPLGKAISCIRTVHCDVKGNQQFCADLAKRDIMAELQHNNAAHSSRSGDRVQRRNLEKLPEHVGLVSF